MTIVRHICQKVAASALLVAAMAFLVGTCLSYATPRMAVIELAETAGELHMHSDGVVHAHGPVRLAASADPLADPSESDTSHKHEKAAAGGFQASANAPSVGDGVGFSLARSSALSLADTSPYLSTAPPGLERPPRTRSL